MADFSRLRMIVFDVDGVLTDGSIIVNDQGQEAKRFYVRDGLGIRIALRLGLKVGVLTGRSVRAVTLRMAELGVDLVQQGSSDKAVGLETLCQRAGVLPEETAYVGDDLIDLPALLRCGYPMAVADAVAEVRAEAQYITTAVGGRGAAREAIEHLLKSQGRWDEVVDRYVS